MTATDELRRMLDERGVGWDALSNMEGDRITRWMDANGRYVSALDCGETQYLADFYWGPTPQQAIEATLGSCNCSNSERTGTCHITDNGPWGYPYVCSECGASFDADVNNGEFNFCPNCGRSVEQ